MYVESKFQRVKFVSVDLVDAGRTPIEVCVYVGVGGDTVKS